MLTRRDWLYAAAYLILLGVAIAVAWYWFGPDGTLRVFKVRG